MAGVATLFTREFFEAARARLDPDGLLCQWAHTYDISQEDLQSIVRTFASVFPRGTMWLVGEADLLLIGGPGADVRSRLAALPSRLRNPSTAGLLATVNVRVADAPVRSALSLQGRAGRAQPLRRERRRPDRRPAPGWSIRRREASTARPGWQQRRGHQNLGRRPASGRSGRSSTPPPTRAGPRAAHAAQGGGVRAGVSSRFEPP
jgi:hypothetical protein